MGVTLGFTRLVAENGREVSARRLGEAHNARNLRLNYGCSIEQAADGLRKRSSKAIGRPGVRGQRGVRLSFVGAGEFGHCDSSQ
jgi:hypothetical protein